MDHSHCDFCVRVSAYCHQQSHCSVDYCPNGCGFSMHQCKLSEHEQHTCPEALTSCPNAVNGCEEVLKRKKIRNHIEHCPASIIFCQFSHQRREEKPPMVAIDVLFDSPCHKKCDLIDEKLLEGDLHVWETARYKVTKNTEQRTGPEWTYWRPKWVEKLSLKKAGTQAAEFDQPVSNQLHDVSATDLPNLSLNTKIGLTTNFYWIGQRRFSRDALNIQSRTCADVNIKFAQDSWHSSIVVPGSTRVCDFYCNEMVRRDEFSSHWKTLHVDVHLGELVRRCPMRAYGCPYGVLDRTPNPKGSALDYDKDIDCVLYKAVASTELRAPTDASCSYAAEIQKKQELAMYGYDDFEEESYDVLGQLPPEVLMEICGHLDSQALWILSQVNHYLRKVCLSLVKKTGIVSCSWEQDNSGVWVPGPKVWRFSKAFYRELSSWSFTDEPTVAAHMMSCDYIKANVKPYSSDREQVLF